MDLVFGTSGFAKELDSFFYDIQEANLHSYSPDFFIGRDFIGQQISGVSIISEEDFKSRISIDTEANAFIAVGSPIIKNKIFKMLAEYKNLKFPTVIHPKSSFDKRPGKVSFGQGTIVCPGAVITTEIHIGDFVLVYLNTTIGHETSIGDFSTISPGANISGNVKIGKNVFIGTGAMVLERLTICDDVIIGAGAVVNRSITEPGVYVGVPAKKIK